MTVFRSQADGMLTAKFDPEPWICKGMRYPVQKCGDCVFDPRPEFIPREYEVVLWDGRTLDGTFDSYRDANAASTWYTGSYVRDVRRPEPNPILVAFRNERAATVWQFLASLDEPSRWWPDGTPEHIDHARKVLARLAALSA